MAEIVQDDDTGELFVRIPGKGWQPITEEEAEIASQGSIESAARGAAAGAKEIGLGALAATDTVADAIGLPANPNADWLAEERAANEAYQETQREFGGPAQSVAQFAPNLLGFGAGSTIKGIAAAEGLIGAATFDPDTLGGVAGGFALGAGAGAGGVMAGRAVEAATRKLRPSLARGVQAGAGLFRTKTDDAARAADAARPGRMTPEGWLDDMPGEPGSSGVARPIDGADDFTNTGQQLEGFRSVEELKEMGVPLTRGDEAILRAESRGAAEGAQAARAREEVLRSNAFTDDFTRKIGKTRDAQQAVFTRMVGQELGEDLTTSGGRLTDTATARLRGETQQVFKDLIDRPAAQNIDLGEAATQSRQLASTSSQNAAPRANEWANKIEEAAASETPGANFSDLRSGLGKDMESAFANNNHELGTTLSQMQETLDEALEATLTAGEKAKLQTARRRWRIFKALERQRARDPGGEINLRTFQNAYKSVTPAAKRNAGARDDFEKTMETLVFLNDKITPNSGTADRILANVAGGGKAEKGVGLALGANAIFGD